MAPTVSHVLNEYNELPEPPQACYNPLGLCGRRTVYAVVETGGKQMRIWEGQTVRVDRIHGEPGQEVVLDRVLLVTGERTVVGNPWVPGARVVARIVQQGRGRKVVVFKYKPKVRYRRKRGHRQPFTELRIERIELPA